MAAKKTSPRTRARKAARSFVAPEFPPEVQAALGMFTIAVGKFGELAERFVAAFERMAVAAERANGIETPAPKARDDHAS